MKRQRIPPPAKTGRQPPSLSAHRTSVALFAGLILLVLLTFRHYGIAADEPTQHEYGQLLLRYYTSLGQDFKVLYYWNWHLYGGAFELLTAWLDQYSPLATYETRHLLTAATGLLGIAGCWKIAACLAGPQAAFWSALLLASTPRFYGQIFMNSKDVPFAAGYIWSLYLLLRCIPLFPAIPVRLLVSLGVVIGLTLGIRVGGLLLLGYLGAAIAVHYCIGVFRTDRAPSQKNAMWRLGGTWLGVAGIAYTIMVACWPYAQVHPITGPWHALSYFSHFKIPLPVLYRGLDTVSNQLPWDYLLHYLLISLPEIVLVLLAGGVVAGIRWLKKTRRASSTVVIQEYGLLIFAIVFPIGYVIAQRSPLYNGMRHMLFLLPPIAVIAGVTLAGSLNRLRTLGKRWRVAATTILAIYGIWHLSLMVRLHPYEYMYFNGLAGGLRGAEGRYDLEYWNASLSEVARALVSKVEATASEGRKDHSYKVLVCPGPGSVPYHFSEQFSLAESLEDADFYISSTNIYCRKSVAGETILTVTRFGVLLAYVKDRRDLKEPRMTHPL